MKRQLLFYSSILMLVISCQGNPYKQGAWLYENRCANCHMQDGSGLGKQIPPLNSSSLLMTDREKVACQIYRGVATTDSLPTQLQMPANEDLTPAELANLMNYMLDRWYPAAPAVKDNETEIWIQSCKDSEKPGL